MPIATRGAIKGAVSSEDLFDLNPQIILSNTYHLLLEPGIKTLEKVGGLHELMKWDRPILTDSGGFQVFSLSKIRKISEKGVTFSSHIDGRKIFLSPEDAIDTQLAIGSDILMVLDECVGYPAKKEYVRQSVDLTTLWAKRSKEHFEKRMKGVLKSKRPLLFGIVQGGVFSDLREKSAHDLMEIGFDGYAVGGLAVGEPRERMLPVLKKTIKNLPEDKPRYLMGVGKPEDIFDAVRLGVDMFDCVIPTRNARHGSLFSYIDVLKTKVKYDIIHIKKEKYSTDIGPIDKRCSCLTCKNYSKAYLRHLFRVKEMLYARLATIHNLHCYLEMMRCLRKK